ncbi:MAG: cytochrome c [Magnetovibrio sp.]|nr:cytochrome c [Magnetovibrio sp.]
MNKLYLKISVLALLAGASVLLRTGSASAAETVDVTIPAHLSPLAQWGAMAFDQNCASCHGENGSGTKQGPPLIHKTYNPGHHGDESFFRAIRSGVTQHHWPYGDMPAQPQVDANLAKLIIQFVREVQVKNGIVYQPHRM